MTKILTTITFLCIAQTSFAEPLSQSATDSNTDAYKKECIDSSSGRDFCKINIMLANAIKTQLPMAANQNLTVIEVEAKGAQLNLTEKLSVTKAEMKEMLMSDTVIKPDTAEIMTALGRKQFCDGDTAALIEKGLKVNISYVFNDMKPYISVTLDTCKGSSHSPFQSP